VAKNGFHSQVRLLKAIGHPARLQILYLLREGEECVCHLTAALRQRQAYVSQQLMFLRQAGLLEDRKDGLRVYYQVKDPRIFDLIDDLGKILGQEPQRAAVPEIFASCSCPKCESTKGASGQKA
jgi:DNA-binding transcriptional ArsR family regulator